MQQQQQLSSPGNDVQYFELFKLITVFSALSDASYASKTHPHTLHFPGVLDSAGIELSFFLVAGTVLCFGFSVRILLITR